MNERSAPRPVPVRSDGRPPAEELHCSQHGKYYGWPDSSTCPFCSDVLREAHEKREAALSRANLRGRFRACTFESFEAVTSEQRRVATACQQFVDGFSRTGGGGLWLIGPVGTGKTHLGAAMTIRTTFDRKLGAVMTTGRELVRELRSTWKPKAESTEEELIEFFGDTSLLVLDEVGVGFGTEAEQTQLLDVLDMRYQLQRPTVLLSNLKPEQIRDAVGERSYDRLREGSKVLVCNWPSHRSPLA